MSKPKPGFEERHQQIFRIIKGTEKQELSFFDKLKGKKNTTNEQLLEEWSTNSIPAYETIRAPKVGRDKAADDWIIQKYEETDKPVPLDKFIEDYEGYYVIELAEELDGVPVYIAFEGDKNVFRARFLRNCTDLIGEDLLGQAWETKLADDALTYGKQLMMIADKTANENDLVYLKEQRMPPDGDEESLATKLHILYAAAKWLIFYGKNGHGYEADF